jgi:hypothetical protein
MKKPCQICFEEVSVLMKSEKVFRRVEWTELRVETPMNPDFEGTTTIEKRQKV